MKAIGLVIGFMIIYLPMLAQEKYYPPRPEDMEEDKYRYYTMILKNTYTYHDNGESFNNLDYYNMAFAFAHLKEPKEKVFGLLETSFSMDGQNLCELLDYMENNGFEKSLQVFHELDATQFNALLGRCEKLLAATEKEDAATQPETLTALQRTLDDIAEKDQRYRKGKDYKEHWKEQIVLDEENQQAIANIIDKEGYPGTDKVGEERNHIAWLVIQHAVDIAYQEKYLGIIQEAVAQDQVPITYFQMLIDRICTKKFGQQIYGSQSNPEGPVPVADEETAKQMLKKLNL